MHFNKYIVGLLIFVQSMLFYPTINHAETAYDFTEAKTLARMIWTPHRETFYCGCQYSRKGYIHYKSCAYQPVDPNRSKRISWEHVVPVSWYGKSLTCWKGKKGRQACRQQNINFRAMEADLHNLVPAIREINTRRSNYRFTEFPDVKKTCLTRKKPCCAFFVDESTKRIEPRDEVKGMAARITLYITSKYGITLYDEEKERFERWNKRFPPTAWEIQWHEKVVALQGDRNPYIDHYNKKKRRG